MKVPKREVVNLCLWIPKDIRPSFNVFVTMRVWRELLYDGIENDVGDLRRLLYSIIEATKQYGGTATMGRIKWAACPDIHFIEATGGVEMPVSESVTLVLLKITCSPNDWIVCFPEEVT